MEHIDKAFDLIWMVAVVVAAGAHLWAKLKEQKLTGAQLLAAIAEEAVRLVEQQRKTRVKASGTDDSTPGDLRAQAVDYLLDRLDVPESEAVRAVEAAVTKLPKSNLALPRDAQGRFTTAK